MTLKRSTIRRAIIHPRHLTREFASHQRSLQENGVRFAILNEQYSVGLTQKTTPPSSPTRHRSSAPENTKPQANIHQTSHNANAALRVEHTGSSSPAQEQEQERHPERAEGNGAALIPKLHAVDRYPWDSTLLTFAHEKRILSAL